MDPWTFSVYKFVTIFRETCECCSEMDSEGEEVDSEAGRPKDDSPDGLTSHYYVWYAVKVDVAAAEPQDVLAVSCPCLVSGLSRFSRLRYRRFTCGQITANQWRNFKFSPCRKHHYGPRPGEVFFCKIVFVVCCCYCVLLYVYFSKGPFDPSPPPRIARSVSAVYI